MVNRWTQVWFSCTTALALFFSGTYGIVAFAPAPSFRESVLVYTGMAGGLFVFSPFVLRLVVPAAVNAFLFTGLLFAAEGFGAAAGFSPDAVFGGFTVEQVHFLFLVATAAWAALLVLQYLLSRSRVQR